MLANLSGAGANKMGRPSQSDLSFYMCDRFSESTDPPCGGHQAVRVERFTFNVPALVPPREGECAVRFRSFLFVSIRIALSRCLLGALGLQNASAVCALICLQKMRALRSQVCEQDKTGIRAGGVAGKPTKATSTNTHSNSRARPKAGWLSPRKALAFLS